MLIRPLHSDKIREESICIRYNGKKDKENILYMNPTFCESEIMHFS